MPYLKVRDVNLYYEDTETGNETIVFSHGLLWSGKMFAAQVAHLKKNYRVITYDHRGQGQSEATPAGYSIDNLSEDAVAFIKALGINNCHFAGLSMGGFVGMRLAARYPGLLKSLILLETSAEPEPQENHLKYRLLNFVFKVAGPGPITGRTMQVMFGKKFLEDKGRIALRKYWEQELRANKRSITRSVNAVIERNGIENELANIKCPVLILVGDQDMATTPEKSQNIHRLIPQSKLVIVPGAGHTSSVEEPEFVNSAIADFLKTVDS